MAKNQGRTPGRDVRGGSGRRERGTGAGSQGRSSHRKENGRDGRDVRATASSSQRGQRGQARAQQARTGRKPREQRRDFDLIEGRRAVEEALELGIPLRSALVAEPVGERDQALGSLLMRLDEAGVPVEGVPRSRLDQLSSHGAHQGIVVRARPFEYAGLRSIIRGADEKNALVVVLDHVTDEGNFGAIVRSAEVVGAAGVVIANARAAKVGVGAYKTSAGAVLHLPIAQVPNLPRALDELKGAGFWACAATEHATEDVWHAPLTGRVALVMGSEGEGISRLMLERCDFSCRLPQRGRVESLNVAQAATVLCYEWLRRVSEAADA